jgi:succinyl-CoA synthetase alpha subunit
MSIIINKQTKVIIQGITGNQGRFHAKLMKEYGTHVVAGVTPGKKGEVIEGIPVYDTVAEALKEHKADFSCIFVPAAFAKKACFEALDNNLNLVIITEGIPVLDTLEVIKKAGEKSRIVIGPNCPGIISVGESKIGIMPVHIFKKGKVGVISRSGTLTYEIINELSRNNVGQSTVIGIGGDAVIGLNFIEALEFFKNDPATEAVAIIGEIGGFLEEKTAEYLKKTKYPKKIVAYIAGISAPEGKRMGHAGAIISGRSGTAESKILALQSAGVNIARTPKEIASLIKA